ncbi:type III polyketide synthase [Lentibacillus saliphilus]|uniref:type III polyketide synthase n=1 Tax=Lentibacillus saliphilus TaxID=2737028 RepID=UPI001C2F2929|nr:3-oxoacyl-[acyl-carrier-protein] synthase III C-terminal domain-containing protein [Lentibacillus saliphilus]
MSHIASIGLGVPEHTLPQATAKKMVEQLFVDKIADLDRLLSVFDHADIDERQLVVELDWLKKHGAFKDRNDVYVKAVLKYALMAIDNCLKHDTYLTQDVPYEAIDLIVFVSSTGISTPSIDAQLINARPFNEQTVRMPLWGLGCAGGAIGLSLAHDWLTAYPNKTALVICAETASLTFQQNDLQPSNIVGTALFGDGVGAALLIGEQSKYVAHCKRPCPSIVDRSAYTVKDTLSIMGWNVTNSGFEVVFSKEIPSMVHTVWKQHVEQFLQTNDLSNEQIHSYIVHPGGKKVLNAMTEALQIPARKLLPSRDILRQHGNMSSATVLYVLENWMNTGVPNHERSILSALGPGFSSELLLLEWM